MGRVIDAGGRVTVLTLTRGTKGTSDPADYDQPHFGARRERELRASLAELGVHDVRIGDHRDGELDLAAPETAIALVADTIARRRARHHRDVRARRHHRTPDHCVLSAWVTEAWRRTPGAELLYATMTDEHVAQRAELHERIGLFADRGPAGPASVPADRIALVAGAVRTPSSPASAGPSPATRARPSRSPR